MQPDSQSIQQSNAGPDTAYLDQNGHAQLRKSIVGFLDIHGFSSGIESTMEQVEAQLLVNRIRAAIDDSKQYVRKNPGQDSALVANPWALKFFSDNLVVGYPFEGTPVSAEMAARFFIRASQRYQLRMALNGFFLRGALTRHDVLPKYGWACRYHNMFCHWHRDSPGYADRFRIDRVDESSKICRLGDAPPISERLSLQTS